MKDYKKPAVILILLLLLAAWFVHNTRRDLPLIFQKDLLAHDESSNSVVAANITRKFFPPMVRINPLDDQQGIWMEGPYWQHIPPLFAYIPYLFFKLDGHVTIEMKRLSYALLTLLTGLMFIWIVYRFTRSVWPSIAAFAASLVWINTPFTRDLVTGAQFGVSDIVLAFAAVAAFGSLLWYLDEPQTSRLLYSWRKVMPIAFLAALPILAKNLLGAIPVAIYFLLLLRDHRRISRQFLIMIGSVAGILLIYLLPQYLASPDAFKKEIFVAFFHLQNLEGWGRPWHWYFTNYLPQDYLHRFTWVYFSGIILAGAGYFIAVLPRKQRILLGLSLLWFGWNLLAISLVKSKIPNFIYQSYLFSLFAIALIPAWYLSRIDWRKIFNPKIYQAAIVILLILSFLAAGKVSLAFGQEFQAMRIQPYAYSSEHEKFYQVGEWMQAQGINSDDLTIVHVSDNDCWFRYYIIFLTGAESKTLLELYFNPPVGDSLKQKYQTVYFVINKTDQLPDALPSYQRIELADYSLVKFDLSQLTSGQIQTAVQAFIDQNQAAIQQNVLRIKKDLNSCQWLVPDPILNAP